jgi:hypothetical protein
MRAAQMTRQLIGALCTLSLFLAPTIAWEASVSQNLTIAVTSGGGGGNQSIQSVVLSGDNVTYDSATGPFYVGTLTANMSPTTPVFSGAYQLVGSGGSCSGGDTTHFQIVNGDVETAGTSAPAAGSYTICVTASETGLTSVTQAFTITAGHLINAQSAEKA